MIHYQSINYMCLIWTELYSIVAKNISILQGIACCVSMTENRDHREIAIAEHVNDILKEEWLNKEMITTLSQARNLVGEVRYL